MIVWPYWEFCVPMKISAWSAIFCNFERSYFKGFVAENTKKPWTNAGTPYCRPPQNIKSSHEGHTII